MLLGGPLFEAAVRFNVSATDHVLCNLLRTHLIFYLDPNLDEELNRS